MRHRRAIWLVFPSVGLWFATGCGGPVPEPPAARAPVAAARPALADGAGQCRPAPIAHPAGPDTEGSVELPRVRLVQVRPIPLADGRDFQSPARTTSFVADGQSILPLSSRRQWADSQPSFSEPTPSDSDDSTPRMYRLASPPNETPPTTATAGAMHAAPARSEFYGGAQCESERTDLASPDRTPELYAVCQRSEALNHHGFELAQRGAIYSARQEYMQSLHTVAEALDAQRGSHAHQRMLAAGFRALEEADDFAAGDMRCGAELNVAEVARSHQTPVLKGEAAADWNSQAAMGRYLTYAQEQLAGAVGDIPQGSAALFGLGKVYSVPPAAHGPKDATDGAKAVVYYQAALMVDGRNFMAANELGVALVRFGRLPEARAAFLHSLSISPQPVVWQNLAAVHQSLGENVLAERARQSAIVAANQLGRGSAALTAYDVKWVDPTTFSRSMPIDADPIKGAPSSQPPAEHKSIADALPWWSGSKRQ